MVSIANFHNCSHRQNRQLIMCNYLWNKNRWPVSCQNGGHVLSVYQKEHTGSHWQIGSTIIEKPFLNGVIKMEIPNWNEDIFIWMVINKLKQFLREFWINIYANMQIEHNGIRKGRTTTSFLEQKILEYGVLVTQYYLNLNLTRY